MALHSLQPLALIASLVNGQRKEMAHGHEALAQLGLTIDDLKGLSPEQQFKAIADRIAGITDPTLRAAAAMELFGKSGTGLPHGARAGPRSRF